MNITWVYPAFLFAIPALAILFLLRRHHHVRSRIARPKVKRLLASPSGISKTMEAGAQPSRGAGWFGLLSLCLACAALARPQWGEIQQQTYERSRQVVIALDLSRSMLATDVPPSRLDRAKLLVDSLVNELQGERIGLTVFAGTSFVQCPLSNDYEILREMLKEVSPSFLPQQGTDFGKLLQTSYKAFDFSSSSDRFLIVLSDGEDLAGDWEDQLKSFKESNIRIISLGVGTAAGSVLPEKGGGVIKDDKGAVVLSRLDSRVLQQLAGQTGGQYVEAYRWVDLPAVISQTVDRGEKGEYARKEQVLKVERFQIPLALAFVFALLSLWRDFPVYPRTHIKKPSQLEKSLDRHLKAKVMPPPIPSAARSAAFLLLLALPLNAQQLPPGPGAAPADAKPVEKLSGTVRTLSAKDGMTAPDYAQLATETIGFGKAMQAAQANIQTSVIDDAILGVDQGENLDTKAADWPTLRRELEELKKKSSDQKKDDKKDQQDQKNQDQQNKDKQDQQQDQKDPQDKNSGQSGDQDQNRQNRGQNQGQDPKDQQQQGRDPNKDQNSDGDGQQQQQHPQPGQGDEKQDQASKPQQGQDEKEQRQNQARNQPQPANGQKEDRKEQEGMKQVGGAGSNGQKEKAEVVNAESAEMARKLDQIKKGDSPGKVFQLFSPQQPSKEIKGKTW